ncbi:MAG: phospholipase D family protein [Oxalobacteraceae bacterium]|nr:phospholipase D family protein [Oxalobacteraceae bacterium]
MQRMMRFGACVCAALMLAFVSAVRATDQSVPVMAAKGTVQVAFPPWDDAESLLLETLRRAQREILVQAYLLTSRPIAASLIAAKQRGLEVSVLADAHQHADNPASLLVSLTEQGIPVWLETRYRHAHNKIMVIDDGTQEVVVVTGSYNFTRSAQHMNAENLVLIRGNLALARRFRQNWERHRADARALKPAGAP